jgi:gliding motility-associated-like protein
VYNIGTGNQSTGQFGNLPSGSYTVTVTDGNGCTTTVTIQVLEPAPLSASATQDSVGCNGVADGSVNVTATGGTLPYVYNIGTGNQSTGLFNNLPSGSYTVTVTDGNGCTTTVTIQVLEPAQLSASATQDSVGCNGVADGSVNVTATGGTLPYVYNIGTGNQATGLFNNLPSGSYTVTVTDGNGCTTTVTIQVLEPAPLSASATQDSVGCNGVADGSVNVTATGGTLPYVYNIGTGNQSTGQFGNLPSGSYTVTVTDGNGCTTTVTIQVLEPAPLSASATQDSVGCNGVADGSVNVTATGGTLPYVYNIGTGNQSTGQFGNLPSGSYTVTVTDGNSCTTTVSIQVLEPAQLSASATQDSVSCNGSYDGDIIVSTNGGTAPYTFDMGSGPQSSGVFSGLGSGAYYITVTDINGCTVSTSASIFGPNGLIVTATQDSVSCNGNADGGINAVALGGTLPYVYNIGTGNQASGQFGNLPSGSYTVTVTDGNGCTTTVSIQVLEPTQLSAVATQDSVGCNGLADGSVNVTAMGGTLPYVYNIGMGNQTTGQFTNLPSGSYTVTVTDGNGCTTTVTIQVLEPAQLSASATQDSVGCNGVADGSVNVTATGGTLPYVYNIGTGNQSTGQFGNLPSGSYTVTVTDGNGCTTTVTIQVLEPTQLSASATQDSVGCNGVADGSMNVTATGGTLPYVYNIGAGNQATGQFTNLPSGSYTVTVTDGNGCTTTVTIQVIEPALLTASATQASVSCYGVADGSVNVTATGGTLPYVYNIGTGNQATNQFNNLPSGSYMVTVTDSNGCTTNVSIQLMEPVLLTGTIIQMPVSCNGFADGEVIVSPSGGTVPYSYNIGFGVQNSNVFDNLPAGTYTVTVSDANACTTSISTIITEPSTLTTSSSNLPVTCGGYADGELTVIASGGVAPYGFNIGTGSQNNGQFYNLPAGNYNVTVTDANGCTEIELVALNEPTPIQLNLVSSPITCNGLGNGSITVNVSGGTAPYTYNRGTGSQSGNFFGNLTPGQYSITVTDANGCEGIGMVTVTQPSGLAVLANVSNITCNGFVDGEISVTAFGGTSPYLYNIGAGNVNTNLFENLPVGSYTITVTDANGCVRTVSAAISEPAILTATATGTGISCSNLSNGSIVVNALGGTAPYSYNLGLGQSFANPIQNLASGAYTVTITDARGCTTTTSANVASVAPLLVTASTSPVTCFGFTDGQITVSVSGGTAPYLYNRGVGGAQASNQFTNLAAGTYSITVSDANGCTGVVSQTVTSPTGLSLSANTTDILCNGQATGQMIVSATGGTTLYTYNIGQGNQNNGNFSNLAAGFYTVTVTDNNGCSASVSRAVTEPTLLEVDILVSASQCFGQASGQIDITATGGVQPYTYNIGQGVQTTSSFTNLIAGTYGVSVSDANGCQFSTTVVLNQPLALSAQATVDAVSCNGDTDGSILVTPLGGTSPYLYNIGQGVQVSNTFTNLSPASYTITVTDANACSTVISQTVVEPQLVSVQALGSVACNGLGSINVTAQGGTAPFLYNIGTGNQSASTFDNLNPGSYTITVTDVNGCSSTASASITLPQGTNLQGYNHVIEYGQLATDCYNYDSELQGSLQYSTLSINSLGVVSFNLADTANYCMDWAGLAVGFDTVLLTMTDVCGVSDTIQFFIEVMPLTEDTTINTVVGSTITVCIPGLVDELPGAPNVNSIIDLAGSNISCGTLLGFDSVACITYLAGNNPCTDTIMVISCSQGWCDTSYVYIITGNGVIPPIAVNDTVTVVDPTLVTQIEVLVNDSSGGPGIVLVGDPVIVQAPANGDVFWDVVNGVYVYLPNPGFCGVDSFIYQITNQYGLSDVATVYLITECEEIHVYNGISPNGDGLNDVLIIAGIERFPDNRLEVYNRWGNLVFETNGYDHTDATRSFRGIWNDLDLPDGTYFYHFNYTDEVGIIHEMVGYIEIRR